MQQSPGSVLAYSIYLAYTAFATRFDNCWGNLTIALSVPDNFVRFGIPYILLLITCIYCCSSLLLTGIKHKVISVSAYKCGFANHNVVESVSVNQIPTSQIAS